VDAPDRIVASLRHWSICRPWGRQRSSEHANEPRHARPW
jgi:hypothetical protein